MVRIPHSNISVECCVRLALTKSFNNLCMHGQTELVSVVKSFDKKPTISDVLAQARSRPHCPISKYSWIYEHAVRLPGSLSFDMVQLVWAWHSHWPRGVCSAALANVLLSMRNEWTFEPWTFEPLVPVSDWNRGVWERDYIDGNRMIAIATPRPCLDIKYRFSDS